jgi:Transposase DDE domain
MRLEVKRTPSGGYAQNWSAYDKAQANEKKLFQTLLRELCSCVEESEQANGRPRLPLGDMIFCAAFKVYSTFSARRFMTDLREAHKVGLIRRLPHCNSISQYLRKEGLTPVLTNLIELSSLPLASFEEHIAVDSTGFGVRRYARWIDARTLDEKAKREWVKVHLACGARTNVVASVLVTSSKEADSPHFGRLVGTAARHFNIMEVSADKGYLSAENMRFALIAGAIPYIAFRENCRLDADYKSTFWKRMLYLYKYRQHEFAVHYNLRNNVETTFSMIKAKFGNMLRSKETRAQINEALCKVLCHNLCVLIQSIYELGIEPEFSAHVLPPAADPSPSETSAGGRIVAGTIREREAGEQSKRWRNKASRRGNQNQLNLFVENGG